MLSRASPHTRGWTRDEEDPVPSQQGFPAHAGMDRSCAGRPATRRRLPRTRGDGPEFRPDGYHVTTASPHTRGWTRDALLDGHGRAGFPAHAGMDLIGAILGGLAMRLPRTRGDGPGRPDSAPTPRTASPHTRGWTRPERRPDDRDRGFPAHAGMDPSGTRRRQRPGWLPRTRGDGPTSGSQWSTPLQASPHTRGWTRRHQVVVRQPQGFPAHAGMDPDRRCGRRCASWLPRTRGDGPSTPSSTVGDTRASPHTRGWIPVF